MPLGRQRDRQAEMLVTWSELPRSPGHVFYDRLQAILIVAGFDSFVEQLCASHYAVVRGRPSLPAGRYVRMLLIGYFQRHRQPRVRGHWAFKAGHGPVNSLIWLDFDWELRRKQLK